ncbi:MAG: hypothetical protein ACYTGP_04175 [Planctomycetota bacterium]|jgi:hypothetical protein
MSRARLAIFLLIGFVLTILVAWTLSATIISRVRPMREIPADDPLLAALPTDREYRYFGAQQRYGFGCDSECVYANADMTHDTLVNLWVARAGWPFRCLRGTRVSGATDAHGLRNAWPIPERRLRVYAQLVVGFLPYEPLWPGLVANTAFYGAAAWAVVCGPGLLRRRSRRRRGACLACGYLLAGLDRCPECGTAR